MIQSFLTFDSTDRTLKCDHSLERCWAVLHLLFIFSQFAIVEHLSILNLAFSRVVRVNLPPTGQTPRQILWGLKCGWRIKLCPDFLHHFPELVGRPGSYPF